MAAVCSWCGAVIDQPSETIDFVCAECASSKDRAAGELVDRREWSPWMPAGDYPDLNKKDTRRL